MSSVGTIKNCALRGYERLSLGSPTLSRSGEGMAVFEAFEFLYAIFSSLHPVVFLYPGSYMTWDKVSSTEKAVEWPRRSLLRCIISVYFDHDESSSMEALDPFS